MTKTFHPERLDVKAFAQAGGHLAGHATLLKYERLAEEAQGLHPDLRVDWYADAELRTDAGQGVQHWLHVRAEASFPMVCQRCLLPVDVPLQVDRWFRFVPDEDIAALEDETSEEDVLAASRDFDLQALLEDELIMEIPVTPRHEICPEPPSLSAMDDDFEAAAEARPNPFAVLGTLRSPKPR